MPQIKVYDNQAERQAAYRQCKGRKRPTQAQMANLAWGVCYAINDAQECGTFPLPSALVTDKPDQTLRNLIEFLNPIWDPVRNPTGRFRRCRDPYRVEEIDPESIDT